MTQPTTSKEIEYEGHGCLDAPNEVPDGSTLCVRTIGGFEREEYNRMDREQTNWKAAQVASYEWAQILKEILEGTK